MALLAHMHGLISWHIAQGSFDNVVKRYLTMNLDHGLFGEKTQLGYLMDWQISIPKSMGCLRWGNGKIC